MSNAPDTGNKSVETPIWTNDFPVSCSLSSWIFPGIGFTLGGLSLASNLLGGSGALIATNTLFGLAFILLALPSVIRILGNRRANSIRIDSEGRVIIRTRIIGESLVPVGLAILMAAIGGFVMWYWDPFSFLPVQTDISNARQSRLIYWAAALLPIGLILLGVRPWRRRLVFSRDGLAYRRFGPTVFIPWDTIDAVTPHDNGHMRAVFIAARPPAQLTALERKSLPNGTTRAKYAIYGMTVDPATIVYVIQRMQAEPETRTLLATSEHPEHLFTGPTWHERIHMEPGQTWIPDATNS